MRTRARIGAEVSDRESDEWLSFGNETDAELTW